MAVWCVLPVRNRLSTTEHCIGLLRSQTYENLKIVVVDDGSTDGTAEYLAGQQSDNISVIRGNGELWWGGAMRLGMAHAIELSGERDFILMLNDDVWIDSGYVETLVEESLSNGRVIVGSRQCDSETGSDLGSGYEIDYFWMTFESVKSGQPNATVQAIPGRGALYPIEVARAIGLVRSNKFKHYLGDLDYSARACAAGWRILLSSRARVLTSAVSSDSDMQGRTRLRRYFSFKSKNNALQRLRFFLSNGPWYLRVTVPLRLALCAVQRYAVRS